MVGAEGLDIDGVLVCLEATDGDLADVPVGAEGTSGTRGQRRRGTRRAGLRVEGGGRGNKR